MSRTDDRLEWFKCRQSLLLGALAGMPPDEGYLYVVVLLRIYEVNGPCPDNARALSLRTHMPVRRVERAIENLTSGAKPKLQQIQGGLINGFAQDEIEDRRELRKTRQESGKEGAKKRWPKTEENQGAWHSKSHSKRRQDPTEIELESEIELGRKDSPSGESSSASAPTMFGTTVFDTVGTEIPVGPPKADDWPRDHLDLFWNAYPLQRRTEKAKVKKKLDQIRKDRVVTWRKLMDGLERYKQTRDVLRGFAKGPMPWLNGGCWDDEVRDVKKPERSQRKPSLLTRLALGIDGEDHDAKQADDHAGPTLDLRPVSHR